MVDCSDDAAAASGDPLTPLDADEGPSNGDSIGVTAVAPGWRFGVGYLHAAPVLCIRALLRHRVKCNLVKVELMRGLV
jgi:hypothetical protein